MAENNKHDQKQTPVSVPEKTRDSVPGRINEDHRGVLDKSESNVVRNTLPPIIPKNNK